MTEATHFIAAAAGPGAPARAILIGGLAGGVLDLGFAFTAWALKGVGPADILRGIASGILGPAARAGFVPVPLGLVCHFLLSFLFAAAFVLVAARVAPVGRQSPWLAGPLYGVAVYFVMNRVVLPLSNFAVPAGGTSLSFADLASHMFLFGLPIALAAHRWARVAS
ncbi:MULTISPECIES: hypothetical protein [Sphingopyxis]|uniref:hypothetical protein n=1 Tax=Sphingopyxis TaxID=165697 RepID=UPI0015CE0A7F|nr:MULTISPECIES: hypothetical protein [Sphingopyxis]NYF30741.1 hypothetical protein [Sphingopyxis sp. JAI108]